MNNSKKEWLKVIPKNFELSDLEEKYILASLLPVMDLSPSSSSFFLEVEKYTGIYKARLTTISQTQCFESIVYERKIYSLVEALKKDVLSQIQDWKSVRSFNFFDHAI